MRRFAKREGWALGLLAVLAVGALVFWRPLRHQVLAALALCSNAAAESTLAEVVDGAADPAKALTRIWRNGQSSGRLFVLAVAVDPAIWGDGCGGHDDHTSHASHDGKAGKSHSQNHAKAERKPPVPDEIRGEARAVAARVKTNHPILVDTQGSMLLRFNVHNFPAYVLVDAEGNVVRCVAGSRSEAVIRAMPEEVNRPLSHRRRPGGD